MSILVLGSLNMDLVVQSQRLPVPGETLLGNHFQTIPGGKGANQAVAIARQQVPTLMVGRVGTDGFGQELCRSLAAEDIDVTGVQQDPHTRTGVAAIAVATTGENHIIVVPGANGQVDHTELTQIQKHLPQVTALLLQFEVPLPVVVEAARLASEAGVTVLVDPAPAQPIQHLDLLKYTDILTPNQVEAGQLAGLRVDTVDSAAKAADALCAQGVKTVLVKLGDQGVLGKTARETFHVPAFPVQAIDTVAAGDAFNGGLAVALHDGQPLRTAVIWAAATAALSVTQSGAQPSMPRRQDVEQFLQHFPNPPPH